MKRKEGLGMKRLDYSLGVLFVTAAIVVHAAFPRYGTVIAHGDAYRIDRWTGIPAGHTLRGECVGVVDAIR